MGKLKGVDAISTSQLLVQWQDGSDNLTSASQLRYDVCWTTTIGGSCVGSATTAPGANSYTISGLAAGARYYVYVRAIDLVNYASAYVGPGSDRTWSVNTNIAVSAGYGHTCSLLSDGTVRCWGLNDKGQLGNNTKVDSPTPVDPGLKDVVAIAAGGDPAFLTSFTCAVKVDGTVWCWGSDTNGELGDDATKADKLVPVQVSGIGNATGITANAAHACALLGTGAIKCWGFNGQGELGNGTVTTSGTPVAVTGISTAVQVEAGFYHTCALLANGSVQCWGKGADGQLGNGLATQSTTPVTVSLAAGDYAKQIDVGGYHTCAVLTTGQVRCWGGNLNGQLGRNNTTQANSPVAVTTDGTNALGNVVAIAAGGEWAGGGLNGSTCALLFNGSVQCWGRGANGQLGSGGSLPVADALVPVTVTSSSANKAITVGRTHACALNVDGTIKCWGDGANYRLGTGATTSSSTQVSVTNLFGPERAIQIKGNNGGYISVGDFTCALMSSGIVRCWGLNSLGQLGTNDNTQRYAPSSPVVGFGGGTLRAKDLSVGGDHACFVLGTGAVDCWGGNAYSQLGDGTTTNRSYAAIASNVTSAIGVSVGQEHSCAHMVNGDVRCWGDNQYSQLGDNTTTTRSTYITTLTSMPPAANVPAKSMVSHGFGGCIVLGDGTMRCWGWNGYGGLGDGTSVDKPYGVAVGGGVVNVTKMASGRHGVCGVNATGVARCAGRGSEGEMGDGTTGSANTTARTVNFNNWLEIAGGGQFHFCGIAVGGNPKCWGNNDSGQVGINNTVISPPQSAPLLVIGRNNMTLANVKAIGLGRSHSCALHADGMAECWGNGDYGQLGDNTSGFHNQLTAAPVQFFP